MALHESPVCAAQWQKEASEVVPARLALKLEAAGPSRPGRAFLSGGALGWEVLLDVPPVLMPAAQEMLAFFSRLTALLCVIWMVSAAGW